MSGKNLKIRITMGPALRGDAAPGSARSLFATTGIPANEEHTGVPTRGVAVAAAAVVLSVAAWLAFSSKDPAAPSIADAPTSTEPAVPSYVPTSPHAFNDAPPAANAPVTATVAAPIAPAAPIASSAPAQAEKPAIPDKPKTAATVAAAAPPPQTATARPAPTKPSTTATTATTPPSSKHIARAILTSGIANREPIDKLKATVKSAPERKSLFFFTEVVDLKGGTITHRWKRDGKTVATMPFRIGSDRYRVYSNKRISPNQTGHWQVEVLNAQGKPIQVAEFEYE